MNLKWSYFQKISFQNAILCKFVNEQQGGTAPPVQDAVGSTMSFQELKELLYKSGINLFPDKDAFCYCEGIYYCVCFHNWNAINSVIC